MRTIRSCTEVRTNKFPNTWTDLNLYVRETLNTDEKSIQKFFLKQPYLPWEFKANLNTYLKRYLKG